MVGLRKRQGKRRKRLVDVKHIFFLVEIVQLMGAFMTSAINISFGVYIQRVYFFDLLQRRCDLTPHDAITHHKLCHVPNTT